MLGEGIECKVVPHDYEYRNIYGSYGINFAGLCDESIGLDMKILTPDDIKNHIYGMAMIWVFNSGRAHHVPQGVISYAGITGFEANDDKRLAVVGGLITLPYYQNKGFGLETTKALCDVASSDSAVNVHGHQGLIARCNDRSLGVVEKLGFKEKGVELGKVIMVKMFV